MEFYLFLLLFYSLVPFISQYFILELIFVKYYKYGWHLLYLSKYFITLSFLPLLFFKNLDLAIRPHDNLSITFILLTLTLSILGLKKAIKKNKLFFYLGGIYASFMEEILFRGIIFGLSLLIWKNLTTAIIISSLSFGLWHIKNLAWQPKKKITIIQVGYTTLIYGPLFAGLRIITSDIYLAVLVHFLVDATVVFAPKWMKRFMVFGGKGRVYQDNYSIYSTRSPI